MLEHHGALSLELLAQLFHSLTKVPRMSWAWGLDALIVVGAGTVGLSLHLLARG